jgi:hypothetical protein
MNFMEIMQNSIFENVQAIKNNFSTFLDENEDVENSELDQAYEKIDDLLDLIKNGFSNESTQNFLMDIAENFKNTYFKIEGFERIANIKNLSKMLIINIRISKLLSDHFLEEYDELDLELREINKNAILINYFGYIDPNDKSSFIGMIDFDSFQNTDNYSEEIGRSAINREILIGFAKTIYKNKEAFDTNKKYIVFKSESKASNETLLSIIKLVSLSRGHKFHIPLESKTQSPSNIRIKPDLQGNFHYQQFNETFVIVSEMIYHKDVLTKYLSVYHVIENYVYRSPIVDLHNSTNGQMFSIRNFKSLYEKTKNNEQESISSFMKKIWHRKINGIEFNKIIKDNFDSFLNSNEFIKSDYDNFMSNFNWPDKASKIKNDPQSCGLYSKLFYSLRNSIVHNKETEFHLSHFNITNSSGFFIDKVFIEPLRDVILELIYDTGSDVWYKRDSLSLYIK